MLVPAIPQSEVLAKFLQKVGKNATKFWRSIFADLRPSMTDLTGTMAAQQTNSVATLGAGVPLTAGGFGNGVFFF